MPHSNPPRPADPRLQGREVTVELLNYRKDGSEFHNLLSVTPVRDAAGRLLSFIGIQSDISELAARRATEQALREAKGAAEAAVEAKSAFLANMSHEIRTPLNGMIAVAQVRRLPGAWQGFSMAGVLTSERGFGIGVCVLVAGPAFQVQPPFAHGLPALPLSVQLLLASALSPEQRELGDTILESGNTLLTILGDILDFSKINHNALVLERSPLELRDAVEASIELVAAEAGRKGLEVAYGLRGEELVGRRIMGDGIRIRQVGAGCVWERRVRLW